MHDVGEIVYGDIPYSAKKGNPELARLLDEAESEALVSITGYKNYLSAQDSLWLLMCDRLEAYLYVREVSPDLLKSGDWSDCLLHIKEMAQELGVLDRLPV
jgi:5'-deoxynucleotidase YfbR-like HD superfamily hydrolase